MSLSSKVLVSATILIILQRKGVLNLQVIQCNRTIANVQYAVHFLLYTYQNSYFPEEIYLDDVESLDSSSFDFNLPTRFVIHGWRESPASNSCIALTHGYLDNGEYNVIVVDWSQLAETEYLSARYSVNDVGLVLARFLEFLEDYGDVSLQDVYLVGFSLGAHIAGFAGKFVDSNIGVIVGLDPALPLFYLENSRCRLANTDADYVLIIHSAVNTFGFARNIGHADFYINYGYAVTNPRTSHDVSYELFANSLYPEYEYWGLNCGTYLQVTLMRTCRGNQYYAILGEDPIETSITGIYNVLWNSSSLMRGSFLNKSTLNETKSVVDMSLNKNESSSTN